MMHVECVSSIDTFINESMITSYILMTHEECVTAIDSFIKKFIITCDGYILMTHWNVLHGFIKKCIITSHGGGCHLCTALNSVTFS